MPGNRMLEAKSMSLQFTPSNNHILSQRERAGSEEVAAAYHKAVEDLDLKLQEKRLSHNHHLNLPELQTTSIRNRSSSGESVYTFKTYDQGEEVD